jgi:methionine aminopeptidase
VIDLWSPSRPGNRITDVVRRIAQLFEFGPHGISLVQTYRGQHDATVLDGYVVMIRLANCLDDRLWEGDLIFARPLVRLASMTASKTRKLGK